jgi:hypothetical protein
MKDAARAEAEARKAERSNRTVEEQLARLDAGGFAACRERKRLAESQGYSPKEER